MKDASDPVRRFESARLDRFEELVRDELARPCPAPDLAPTIMKRLGYRTVSHRAARMARWTRWLSRGSVVLAGLAVIAMSANLYTQSARVRRPDGPSVPAAIETGLEREGSRFNHLLRQLERIAPSHDMAPAGTAPGLLEPQPLPDDRRDSASPVRWV